MLIKTLIWVKKTKAIRKLTSFLATKRLLMLREAVPRIDMVAISMALPRSLNKKTPTRTSLKRLLNRQNLNHSVWLSLTL